MSTEQHIRVIVTANASKDSCILRGNRFVISTRAKAAMNAANEGVRELLAKYFEIPIAQVRIVSGHQKPSKIISIIS